MCSSHPAHAFVLSNALVTDHLTRTAIYQQLMIDVNYDLHSFLNADLNALLLHSFHPNSFLNEIYDLQLTHDVLVPEISLVKFDCENS